MRVLVVPVVLLSSFAAAQQQAQTLRLYGNDGFHTFAKTCPIKFIARTNGDAVMARTETGRSAPRDGQLVTLYFTARDSRQVTAATVDIRGIKQTHPYLHVDAANQKEQSQTFQVQAGSATGHLGQTDVTVSGMSALRIAEITELRYADGTVWRPSAFGGCSAPLSGLRLIDSPMQ